MSAPRRVRLGAVSYLNSRPLTYGLDQDDLFRVDYGVPSACAEDLAAGRIDVGMIPIVEYARRPPDLRIVPGLAIGSEGEVLTVRLFHRGRLDRVRRVAADTSSRTSVVLLRILLRERYGIDPEIAAAPPDLDAMLHGADAALLIGDPVLPLVGPEGAAGRSSLDLGRNGASLPAGPASSPSGRDGRRRSPPGTWRACRGPAAKESRTWPGSPPASSASAPAPPSSMKAICAITSATTSVLPRSGPSTSSTASPTATA